MAGFFTGWFLVLIVTLVVNIAICVWVYKDAESRGMSAGIWVLILLVSGILGLLIYLGVRPKEVSTYNEGYSDRDVSSIRANRTQVCDRCSAEYNASYSNCPDCKQRNPNKQYKSSSSQRDNSTEAIPTTDGKETCSKCGTTQMANRDFCMKCGVRFNPRKSVAPTVPQPPATTEEVKHESDDSIAITEKIKELAKLKDDGILTEDEFASKKKELLDRI